MTLPTPQATRLNMMLPLVKIDVERRLVVGRAAQEVPDKSGEIMDYATAKPAFQKWSKSFEDMSGGLSKGNLRVMHQKTVAGKLVDITYDDDAKAIDVVAKVVDDNEWRKVLEGCYTGFSVGGGYGPRWADGDLKRYTPVVSEMSMVDNPCIPTALFAELLKADGMTEKLRLRGVARTFADMWREPPKTFGALFKAYDETKHERDEGGRFSSAVSGAASYGAIGATAGALSTLRHLPDFSPARNPGLRGSVGRTLFRRLAAKRALKFGKWGAVGGGLGGLFGVFSGPPKKKKEDDLAEKLAKARGKAA